MKLFVSVPVAVLAGTVAITVGGCSSSEGSDGTSATTSASSTGASRPTLTASSLQPPPQDNKYSSSSGRPKVVFDPCTWVSDASITKAGFDPKSRKRGHDTVAETIFLTCEFSSRLRDLAVDSTNATWDENLKKNGAWSEPTSVNGREALWVRDPQLAGACEIDLRTEAGFTQVAVNLTDLTNPQETPPCQGLLDIASAIEPDIGKEN
ncbi:DUF3558 domain-containing protein [Nocardia blacklockiae]|uniref:DUF3558 domain-containing protein n=1 Tax=Nocardia blacklockiae TaxID=480036 RepID=UPI001893C642|nr:DUF3558 domain-containing protein [Nocardia blacklockiae]MBF6172530.1 DUF3558 domain-containing protein [Nocardia blacklockiae]